MTATLVDTNQIKGDELGNINIRFTVQALTDFVGLLNMNKLRNPGGHFLTFRVREYGTPGEGVLEVTMHTAPEVPA